MGELACATITTYDVASGAVVGSPAVLPWQSGEVALSPDGTTTAVTKGADGTTVLLGARDSRVIGVVPPLDAPPTRDWGSGALAFGPDGTLYVGSNAGQVRAVDPSTATVVRTYDVPELSTNVTLVVAGDVLVGVGHQHIVSVDIATGAQRWTVAISGSRQSPCPWFAVSAAAGRIWCGTFHGVIEERSLATGERTGVTRESGLGNVGWMQVTPDGRELVDFGVTSPVITRWRLDGSGPITRLVAPRHVLVDRYQPGGGQLLTAVRPDGPATILDDFTEFDVWDPVSDAAVRRLPAVLGPGWGTADSIAAYDPTLDAIVTVDVASGEERRVPGVTPEAALLRAAPDGRTMFAAMPDGSVDRVEPITGDRAGPTMHAEGWPLSVSAAPDLSRVVVTTVASGDDTGTVYTFDGRTGEQIGDPERGWWSGELGQTALVLNSGPGVQLGLRDPVTGAALGELPSTIGEVSSLQFSDDGRVLAASAKSGSVSVYDVESRIRLGDPIPVDGPAFFSAALRPDGLALAATGSAGILLWDLDAQDMFDAACGFAGRELSAAEWATYLSELGPRRDTCSVARTSASS